MVKRKSMSFFWNKSSLVPLLTPFLNAAPSAVTKKDIALWWPAPCRPAAVRSET